MRKILRAKMRFQAEKQDGKTIKVFRAMWKQWVTRNDKDYLKKLEGKKKKCTKKYKW